jgi:hypothetical protein
MYQFILIIPSMMGQAVTIRTWILEVTGPNLGWVTYYPDWGFRRFPQTFQTKPGIEPWTIPNTYKYFIHRIYGFSDFVQRLDSKELEDKNTTFRKLDLFPSSGERRHLLCWVPGEPMSESHCDWQSVSRSVLVSSPIWGIWPENCLLI